MDDEKIVIEDERREAFKHFLITKLQPDVLKTLNIASQMPNLSVKRRYQLIKCFDAWIVRETTEEVKQALHSLNLISLAVSELGKPDSNSEEACDVICTLMVVCKDTTKYQDLYQSLLKSLLSLKPVIQSLINQQEAVELSPFVIVFGMLIHRILPQSLIEPNNEAIRYIMYDFFLKIYQDESLELVDKVTSIVSGLCIKLQADGSND